MVRNVFSVDVEDWFHILDTDLAPSFEQWEMLPARVEQMTETLLEVMRAHQVWGTFFVLGWIADRYPSLVRRIKAEGHEIASHGYAHRLVYQQTAEQFREDLRRASEAIAAACGSTPRGYRAPGFSIRRQTLWALDILAEEGYAYDSSIFPARRGHGGIPGAHPLPFLFPNGVVEFPISTLSILRYRLAYLGGGYLRSLPQSLILGQARAQSKRGIPLILYLHPRDIDPQQHRLRLELRRYFKSYVGLAGCLSKVKTLLAEFRWCSFESALRERRYFPRSDRQGNAAIYAE